MDAPQATPAAPAPAPAADLLKYLMATSSQTTQEAAPEAPQAATEPVQAPIEPPKEEPKADLAKLRKIEADATARRQTAAREAQARKSIDEAALAKKQLEDLKSSPTLAAFAKLHGLTITEAYRRVTDEVVGRDTPPDPMQAAQTVAQQLAELKADIAKEREQNQRAQEQANIASHQRSVIDYVKSKDDYPAIKALGMEESVYWAMVGEFKNTGTRLTPDQAAEIIEASLVEDAKKLQAVVKPEPPPAQSAPPQAPAPKRTPSTLSNRTASAPPSQVPALKTPEQRFQEAVSMLTK